jgi:hypothetical protein
MGILVVSAGHVLRKWKKEKSLSTIQNSSQDPGNPFYKLNLWHLIGISYCLSLSMRHSGNTFPKYSTLLSISPVPEEGNWDR